MLLKITRIKLLPRSIVICPYSCDLIIIEEKRYVIDRLIIAITSPLVDIVVFKVIAV